ncbi:MAG: FMN-binding glutamate synthase family protein, partial [Pseudomonadota bacterium]
MRVMFRLFEGRFLAFTLSALVAGLAAAALVASPFVAMFLPLQLLLWVVLGVCGFLALIGLHDLIQTRHAILRNYPILAHLRFFFEKIRPEMRQYFFEDDKDGRPFSRDKRAIVYQRAKKALDKRPFGTVYDVYEPSYEWLNHSMAPKPMAAEPFRLLIGGRRCRQLYSSSILNISGMSFGAISPNAIRALNRGAKMGDFAQVTGEGAVSRYHKENGGDLVWQLGSGYFGARTPEGDFDPDRFKEVAALDQIKMIELKLSQGAKPGHGGVLPKAKITREISLTRGVPRDRDCVSPAAHPAFSTPIEMLEFIDRLRDLSGGKPVGLKLAVGHRWQVLAICKAMVETDLTPDYIIVDGAEGGTGAAPLEFADHIGMPLRDGLNFFHNALVGCDLRDRVRLGGSGKVASAFDIVRAMALGADFCHAGRAFMFAVGCIQAQSCHTGLCRTG